jgi:hypothetical protein
VIDYVKLAAIDKSKPLTIKDGPSGFTCKLCGAQQEAWAWRVTVPTIGTACPGCAGDHGFEVR